MINQLQQLFQDRRNVIIGLILLVILVIGVTLIFNSNNQVPTQSPTTTSPIQEEIISVTDRPLQPVSPAPPIPSTETIESQGVTIESPYLNEYERNRRGDTTFVENINYSIIYFAVDDQFLISITGAPFETYRKQAENDLLTELNVTQDQACTLDVVISTPGYVNPNEAGQNYSLSWCD